MTTRTTHPKPFLKWAGGKRQLLPHLRQHYPARFGAYIEPFLGSAAVFFDLYARGVLDGHDVRLSDSSVDLIGCYTAVRNHVEDVIVELERLEAGHRAAPEQHYYEVRNERFNPLRRRLVEAGSTPGRRSPRRGGGSHACPPELNEPNRACPPELDERRRDVVLAAMLIYLNRTGYNGLFRLNAAGDFNVPMGRYERPQICDADGLRAASLALRKARTHMEVISFSDALGTAQAGDFTYLDPPYVPLTRTARFTAYTAGGFGSEDQTRLKEVVISLAARGVQVVLSNSAADEVTALYADDARARQAGLRTLRVPARRAINSRGSRRGPVDEYVITNVGC